MEKRIKLYCDMDGVLAEYDQNFTPQKAGRKGYFKRRPVNEQMVELINLLVENGWDVTILSALCKSKYAKEDKNAWLDEHGVNVDKRIFINVGESKADAVKADEGEVKVLLDDYGVNTKEFVDAGYEAIKYLNGINNKTGSWKGPTINAETTLAELEEILKAIEKEGK